MRIHRTRAGVSPLQGTSDAEGTRNAHGWMLRVRTHGKIHAQSNRQFHNSFAPQSVIGQ